MLNLCLNTWLLAEGEVVVEEEGAVGVDPLLGVKVQLEVRIIPITHMEKLEVIMKVTRIWCTKICDQKILVLWHFKWRQ